LLIVSGRSLIFVLLSFLSLASRAIYLRPGLDIGGMSCVGIDVSCLAGCIGHIFVAMSWYSWMMCADPGSNWTVFALSSSRRVDRV